MALYIDTTNCVFGPADEMVVIDDCTWTDTDYIEMSVWTDTMLLQFVDTHNGMSPTEWMEDHYPHLLAKTV